MSSTMFLHGVCLFLIAAIVVGEDDCEPEKYIACMDPIRNSSVDHPHGLFQNADDIEESCPTLKIGIECVKKFADNCGTEMIALDYEDQIVRPAKLVEEICKSGTPLREEYLRYSPCMLEHQEEFVGCSAKIREFLSYHEPDTPSKEITVSCMYEMMLRACFMSTATEKCGLDTAHFVMKALRYLPSHGIQQCLKDDDTAAQA